MLTVYFCPYGCIEVAEGSDADDDGPLYCFGHEARSPDGTALREPEQVDMVPAEYVPREQSDALDAALEKAQYDITAVLDEGFDSTRREVAKAAWDRIQATRDSYREATAGEDGR